MCRRLLEAVSKLTLLIALLDLGCADPNIQLVNGTTMRSGRVELNLRGTWKAVCDIGWGVEEAKVACRQLGYLNDGGNAFPVRGSYFGEQPTHGITNWECRGTEEALSYCTRSLQNCNSQHTAGVYCSVNDGCTDGEVRLVGGEYVTEGRVEVCTSGVWGSVCDDGSWNEQDTQAVCDQYGLGFKVPGAQYGKGYGPILVGIHCSISSLTQPCFVNSDGLALCGDHQTIGVVCQGHDNCTDGDIRLVGGNNTHEGRVEICFSRVWGTVCSSEWGLNEATVVCQQLGYNGEMNGAIMAITNYVAGNGPIHLYNIKCSHDTHTLTNCTHHHHGCTHLEDVGVICPTDVVLPSSFGLHSSISETLTTQMPQHTTIKTVTQKVPNSLNFTNLSNFATLQMLATSSYTSAVPRVQSTTHETLYPNNSGNMKSDSNIINIAIFLVTIIIVLAIFIMVAGLTAILVKKRRKRLTVTGLQENILSKTDDSNYSKLEMSTEATYSSLDTSTSPYSVPHDVITHNQQCQTINEQLYEIVHHQNHTSRYEQHQNTHLTGSSEVLSTLSEGINTSTQTPNGKINIYATLEPNTLYSSEESGVSNEQNDGLTPIAHGSVRQEENTYSTLSGNIYATLEPFIPCSDIQGSDEGGQAQRNEGDYSQLRHT